MYEELKIINPINVYATNSERQSKSFVFIPREYINHNFPLLIFKLISEQKAILRVKKKKNPKLLSEVS